MLFRAKNGILALLIERDKEGKTMNMDFKRKLTIPYDLKQEYPVTADMAQVFEQRDRELKDI